MLLNLIISYSMRYRMKSLFIHCTVSIGRSRPLNIDRTDRTDPNSKPVGTMPKLRVHVPNGAGSNGGQLPKRSGRHGNKIGWNYKKKGGGSAPRPRKRPLTSRGNGDGATNRLLWKTAAVNCWRKSDLKEEIVRSMELGSLHECSLALAFLHFWPVGF
jgi:hypothetical protein